MPIGIGDLQVRDAAAFYAALQAGQFEPLGYLEGMGSRRLLVCKVPLVSPARSSNTKSAINTEESTHGVHASVALVYVRAETLVPRSIRVFDARDRLDRVYDGFEIASEDGAVRPAAMRARSIPDASHIVIRVIRLNLDKK